MLDIKTLTRRVGEAIAVALSVACIVAPLGYAISPSMDDLAIAVGTGIVLGVGVGQSVTGRTGIFIGLGIGSLVGLIAAVVAGNISGRGIGYLVPPVVGFTIGFIDGIASQPRDAWRTVLNAVIIGAAIGLGMVFTLMLGGVIGGMITGLIVGTFACIRKHPQRGWAGGLTTPPGLLLAVDALLVGAAMYVIWLETRSPIAVPLTIAMAVVVPILCFLFAQGLAAWLRPRMAIYTELARYLKVMSVPMGGFAIGYLAIIMAFAGFYGSLQRVDAGKAFTLASDRPARFGDWAFFSINIATGQDDPFIAASSYAARAIVSAQAIICLGWIVVVFAAVMSHLQPHIESLWGEQDHEALNSQDSLQQGKLEQ